MRLHIYVKGFWGDWTEMKNYRLFTHLDRHKDNWRRKRCLSSFFLFFNVWPHTVISLCTAYWGSHYENADVDWTHLLGLPRRPSNPQPTGKFSCPALFCTSLPDQWQSKANQQLLLYIPSKKMSSLSSENTPQITKQNKISHSGEKPILFFLLRICLSSSVRPRGRFCWTEWVIFSILSSYTGNHPK